MEKESYSIDDILSEVKKRREQENQSNPEFKIDEKNKTENEAQPEPKAEETEEEAANAPEVQEAEAEVEAAVEEEISVEEITEDEPIEEALTEEESAEQNEVDDSVPDGYVDILALADDEQTEIETATAQTEEKKKVSFFKTKQGKIFKWIIIILVIAILVVGALAGVYIYKSVNSIADNTQNKPQSTETWGGMSDNSENFPEIIETGADNLSSLQDMIRTWYYNGAPASSSHVFNVLLIGEDTRGDDILEDGTRADSAIIVSINADTKKITLTSVLRDTYGYWEDTPGDPETGKFSKINEAMLNGIDTYINCVEKLYKIDIDNYVIVNFDSFESIIDALGGVEIEITSREIREINNDQPTYGYVTIDQTFEGSSGRMLLDGKQALAYCRIRHLDSDAIRADRQKTCLFEIFNKLKDSSKVTQLKVIDTLLPYVKTGFSSGEIVSIAKYALSKGWLNYDIEMITLPYTKKGGTYYGAWVWKSDFPQDANYAQTMLYGKSSITLAQERVDYKNCNLYGFYEENLVPCYSTITNYSYGEVTTYPSDEDEETTSTSTTNNY